MSAVERMEREALE